MFGTEKCTRGRIIPVCLFQLARVVRNNSIVPHFIVGYFFAAAFKINCLKKKRKKIYLEDVYLPVQG
jgi:hypothetical protein